MSSRNTSANSSVTSLASTTSSTGGSIRSDTSSAATSILSSKSQRNINKAKAATDLAALHRRTITDSYAKTRAKVVKLKSQYPRIHDLDLAARQLHLSKIKYHLDEIDEELKEASKTKLSTKEAQNAVHELVKQYQDENQGERRWCEGKLHEISPSKAKPENKYLKAITRRK